VAASSDLFDMCVCSSRRAAVWHESAFSKSMFSGLARCEPVLRFAKAARADTLNFEQIGPEPFPWPRRYADVNGGAPTSIPPKP